MQISLPSRQHEIALMCHLNLPFRPRYAFPFFRFPAFFAFTVLSSFVEMCVCVWISKIWARAWQHLWFLRKLHTFSYVGPALPYLFLLLPAPWEFQFSHRCTCVCWKNKYQSYAPVASVSSGPPLTAFMSSL